MKEKEFYLSIGRKSIKVSEEVYGDICILSVKNDILQKI